MAAAGAAGTGPAEAPNTPPPPSALGAPKPEPAAPKGEGAGAAAAPNAVGVPATPNARVRAIVETAERARTLDTATHPRGAARSLSQSVHDAVKKYLIVNKCLWL